jgi:hypothetical protein
MCYTYRHDYGLTISDDDKMYTLNSGVTELERKYIWQQMTQIFDNDIAPYMDFKNEVQKETNSNRSQAVN